jgi:hypothetical protein
MVDWDKKKGDEEAKYKKKKPAPDMKHRHEV